MRWPSDPLPVAAAKGRLRRNFQGYTTDVSDALLAFGASAIGETPQGFMQAARDTLQWSERIAAGASPVTRGLAHHGQEDRLRAAVIERLMCDFTVDYGAIATAHGFGADHFAELPETLAPASRRRHARV